MTSPSALRRSLAVFIDTFVFFGVWAAIGIVSSTGSLFYALAVFFLLDATLTAYFGISLGRLAVGIQVARAGGERPGLPAALLRTLLVFLTGWIGMWLYLLTLRAEVSVSRMWWDAAAGTHLVSAR